MKNNYIKAIIELIRKGAEIDSVLSGLSKTLEAKGHTRLHASVLRGVVRSLGTGAVSTQAQVTVTNEADMQKYEQAINTALADLESKESHTTKIDSTLIGGFVAQYNNKILDNSYKAKLVSLYRTLAK